MERTTAEFAVMPQWVQHLRYTSEAWQRDTNWHHRAAVAQTPVARQVLALEALRYYGTEQERRRLRLCSGSCLRHVG